MQLILTKTEVKRGLMGGKTMFALSARVETSEAEWAAIQHFRLPDTVFYRSEIEERGPRQYSSHDASGGILLRFLTKQDKLEITGIKLISGITFENVSLLDLLDLENRVKEAANFFSLIVAKAMVFLGEEKLDLPLV